MKKWFKDHSYSWILSYFFIYCIWFFSLEKIDRNLHHPIRCALDDHIPTLEIFVIPYLLWFLYVAATVLIFLFTDKTDFYHCTAFLFIGMTLSLLVFTLYPSEFDRGAAPVNDNIFTDLVNLIHRIDSPTNVFPSIHCFNSIACTILYIKSNTFRTTAQTPKKKRRRNFWVKFSSVVLTILICLSTLFIKQHSFLDFIAATVLSVIMYVLVYRIPWKRFSRKTREA